jgi:hypothetical protein
MQRPEGMTLRDVFFRIVVRAFVYGTPKRNWVSRSTLLYHGSQ